MKIHEWVMFTQERNGTAVCCTSWTDRSHERCGLAWSGDTEPAEEAVCNMNFNLTEWPHACVTSL